MQRAQPLINTTCPYCGVGCGVIASIDAAGRADITGDPAHPANFGRLCTKGMTLPDTLGLEGRLLHPLQRQVDGQFLRLSWDEALQDVARGFASVIDRHGPDAVAFYLSGQLLTEDYYVANKLMKGFIGSANVDTNSRLCMASTVAGQRRAFGADSVPACYEDLDLADLIVIVGSNTAWCHPILFQRILQSKARGAKIVVIDTRRTVTADSADLFLQIAPGGDQALFCGLLVHLASNGALDADFIARHTTGFEQALETARAIAPNTEAAAAAAGVGAGAAATFFEMFATTPRVVTVFSQGVNQSAQGVDKVNSILNCHLATGRIGKAGSAPFSFTGQPNAMGGREVGGLANMLAAHMGFDAESVDRVRRFWNAPRMAAREGLKAVQMFDAIARGDIKALWVAGTNPAASLPDADVAREALRHLELLVVSDNVRANDTINSGAHLLLPALAWGEKSGSVTNSERRISRQRAFLPAPGEARADWAIFAEVARRMGFPGFAFNSVADVFREHAALSAFENGGRRDFDIGGLAELSDEAYDRLEPTLWPIQAGETSGRSRLFEDGGFFTPDGRAKFVAPAAPSLATQVSTAFPLRLNTGRVRDQWHTMTRTGASPRLARDTPEPFVEIGPDDAAKAGLVDDGFARVATAHGSCVLRVRLTDRQPEGNIFAPIHWTDKTSAKARVGALVAPFLDPISGQPESKATPAVVAPVIFARQGFLLAREPLAMPAEIWWTRVAVAGAVAYRLATDGDLPTWLDFMRRAAPASQLIEFFDAPRGIFRAAALSKTRAELFLSLGPSTEGWDAALDLFRSDRLDATQWRALVTGAAPCEETGPGEGPSVRHAKPLSRPPQNCEAAEYFKILKRQRLLAGLPDDLLRQLISSAHELVLDPADLLFAEGDPGDAVYVVLGGALQIFVSTPAGEELVLAALTTGDLVGEHYLLQKPGGARDASARAAEVTTLLRIEEKVFLDILSRDPNLAKRMEKTRNAREAENLKKRSEIYSLLGSLDAVDPEASVGFDAGEMIFREGDAADALWLIVTGEVSVYREATPDQLLARLGPGQLFGERACLDDAPRNASVRALTRLQAVKISRDHFLRLHELSPDLRAIVSGLQFSYALPQRGVALQYVGKKAGEATIERLYRLKNGQRFLSSWIPAQKAFRLQRLDMNEPTESVQEASWMEPTGGEPARRRSIRLSRSARISAFAAVGEWPEMPQVLEAAIDGVVFSEEALRAFERTGRLDIEAQPCADENACFCLQVSVETIRSLIDAGYDSFESLREKTGCGSLCGGCEPQIEAMLGHAEWTPVVGEAFDIAQDIRRILLKPAGFAPFEWKAGQFLILSGRIGAHWVNRSYTIVSSPGDGRPLEIAVKREPQGLFSRWLFDGSLAEKELRISRPRGDMLWMPSARPTVCFVAGIGVTPALAILRARQSRKNGGALHVDYSGRTPASMAYIPELEAASAADEGITVHFRFTCSTARLSEHEIARVVQRFSDADFFICGPRPYMNSVSGALEAANIPPKRIFKETFAHAGAPPQR